MEDTPTGNSKDICNKCLLGEWLIEEPYALIGHVRFCEGLLRLEPLIAKQYMMKGSEKSRQSLLDETYADEREIGTEYIRNGERGNIGSTGSSFTKN